MQPQVPAGGGRPSDPATASAPATTPDWAVGALDRLDGLIAKVRSATTERLVKIARIVVYGLLAAIMGLTALVLGVIAAVRALDRLIPGPVWSAYLPLGAIFTIAGAFLWSRKTPKPARR
ncbi:MAG TPA: hypothetical protein VHF24_11045 [Acidimicrobiales bacterium]|jgi:hypothetical protein|nr:hypothetical protein [Acidimicrobiales bacterium]